MTALLLALIAQGSRMPGANPAIVDAFTADPAALVHNGRVYLYVGHDEAAEQGTFYSMKEWLVYSSGDMKTWTPHGSPLSVKSFAWAKADAWAGQAVERNGKFYWYVALEHKNGGKSIGVAVGDSPVGPFRDARGSALVTNEMTRATDVSWDDIDPTVLVDGTQAWLVWGNRKCYRARLKESMTELDGPIETIDLPAFEEAPYLHKRKGTYYLSYATGFPERTAYATAPSVRGPWTPRGLLSEGAANSNTAHQAILEFQGKWYFVYHNGMAQRSGGSFRRSVCVDRLEYNRDGTIRRVAQTTEGLSGRRS